MLVSDGTEIDKLLVRIVGDSSQYEATLARTSAKTRAFQQQWLADIHERTRIGLEQTQSVIDEYDRVAEAEQQRQEQIARTRNMLKMLMAGIAIAAEIKVIKDSWTLVVKETENAVYAAQLYSTSAIEAIEEAKHSLEGLSSEWTRFKRELGTSLATPISWLSKAFISARMGFNEAIAGLSYSSMIEHVGVESVMATAAADEVRRRMAARNALTPEELAAKEQKKRTVDSAANQLVSSIEQLRVKLGQVTKEDAEIAKFLRDAGDQAKRIGATETDRLRTLIRQREALESQTESQKRVREEAEKERKLRAETLAEMRQLDEEADQAMAGMLDEQNKSILDQFANELKSKLETQASEAARFLEQTLNPIERLKKELDEVRELQDAGALTEKEADRVRKHLVGSFASSQGLVSTSAGGAVEAGTREARSLTEFGKVQRTTEQGVWELVRKTDIQLRTEQDILTELKKNSGFDLKVATF